MQCVGLWVIKGGKHNEISKAYCVVDIAYFGPMDTEALISWNENQEKPHKGRSETHNIEVIQSNKAWRKNGDSKFPDLATFKRTYIFITY